VFLGHGNMNNSSSDGPPDQQNLFLRQELIRLPQISKNGEDNLGQIIADDNQRYVIKEDAHGRRVRASEWLCTLIAEHVGIAAPYPTIIQRHDGSTVFGSRAIVGAAAQAETVLYLTTPTAGNVTLGTEMLGRLLSGIFALDLFLFNDDRHLGNYLTIDDNGRRPLYAFDFSRALFWHWPFGSYPHADPIANFACKTRQIGTILRTFHGFDEGHALAVLDRIETLQHDIVEQFINGMPADWLSDDERSLFMGWWMQGGRSDRLQLIRNGIKNGSLL
jgi:hypothetical protein